ncbi:MAG: hypothetical protein AB1896_20335, partial [Thermodesulfobacteriota bacterium]
PGGIFGLKPTPRQAPVVEAAAPAPAGGPGVTDEEPRKKKRRRRRRKKSRPENGQVQPATAAGGEGGADREE